MKSKSPQAGFTLVEMLVAVGIFVIVAFIVTSVFITLANANRKAQSIRLVMDNLNFALDSVALKMREGSNYSCPEQLTDCNEVSFTALSGEDITYYRAEDSQFDPPVGRIYVCLEANCSNGGTPITAEQVNITNFTVRFNRQDTKAGPGRARVTLLIQGRAGAGRAATDFNIQTTVSERKAGRS